MPNLHNDHLMYAAEVQNFIIAQEYVSCRHGKKSPDTEIGESMYRILIKNKDNAQKLPDQVGIKIKEFVRLSLPSILADVMKGRSMPR